MPHSTLPHPGFQALILCGPGASLDTFTSFPKDLPKALLPIANRPMVWYPLDWCYRMGVTNITLITPPDSAHAIETALATNPHLTSLPAPKPEVLAPESLTLTSGTGEIFKLDEVAKIIEEDFVVLPCDLICEVEGAAFLQTWMTLQGGLGGASYDRPSLGGEKSGRRGGLAVYYPTKGLEGITTKAEQTDFIATVSLPKSESASPAGSLKANVSKLVMSVPKSTVKDILEEKGALPIRHMLLKRYGRVDMKTSWRDAHIYFFPKWVLEMMKENDFDSIAEDVVGWWAKAGWQAGLGDKLGLRGVLGEPEGSDGEDGMAASGNLEDEVDLLGMSSTGIRTVTKKQEAEVASRVPAAVKQALHQTPVTVPPILSYVQPSWTAQPEQPLIRRADTTALLLSISLRLAKLPSLAEAESASPFAHPAKVAHPDMVKQQSRVSEADSLVAENVSIESRVNIKESVIGAGSTIGSGSRLTRCLLMDGVVIGDGVTLTGCILGRRCKVEAGSRLTDCEVQPGFVVEGGSESKGEKFMAFEGLDQDDGMDVDDGGGDYGEFEVDS
ncbi:Bacterial transferase hexapeptide domain-containing protein [Elsinoe fawcettii]|nr:Bacterial transferase hexapeptide domain-containing protein [Elsinoe fawcettii]